MSTPVAIGIDLGTTFSAVAMVRGRGNPEILPNAEGDRITPSVLYFQGNEVIVGSYAREAGAAMPERVVEFVKRHTGDDRWRFVVPGLEGAGGEVGWGPTELSSLILQKLKHDAELRLGAEVTQAVITVPAWFGERERRATVRAGELAGLKVLALLNEPTAAAFAYGLANPGPDRRVLVLDLGGGTCDASIVGISGRDIGVVATTGDHRLGGKDWDDVLVQHAASAFRERHGIDPLADAAGAHALRQRCVAAKLALSRRDRVSLVHDVDGRTLRLELTRAQFDAMTAHLVARCEALARHVVIEAGLQPAQLDRIVLAGGSTRMPMIRDMVRRIFQKEPDTQLHPDECVAMGAALLAAIECARLSGESSPVDLRTQDVTGHTLGILALRDGALQHVPLIPRQARLPAERVREDFCTSHDNQTTLDLWLVHGETDDPAACTALGRFEFHGLPPRPAGAPVGVTFRYSADGLVEVEATTLADGQRLPYRVASEDFPLAELVAGRLPADTVIVLDTSGSLYGPPFELARASVTRFVQAARAPNRRLGLACVSPSAGPVMKVPLGPDVASTLGALRGLLPVGASPLGALIACAREALKSSVCVQRTIVVVSDGLPDDPDAALEEAARFRASGGTILAIAVGARADVGWLAELAGVPDGGDASRVVTVAPEVPELRVRANLPSEGAVRALAST